MISKLLMNTHMIDFFVGSLHFHLHLPSVLFTLLCISIFYGSYKYIHLQKYPYKQIIGYPLVPSSSSSSSSLSTSNTSSSYISTSSSSSSALPTTTTSSSTSISTTTTASTIVDFLLYIGRLKTSKRTGWINCDVELPESIADHMYRLSIMSFVFANTPDMTNTHDGDNSSNTNNKKNNKIDPYQAMSMAAIHDMAECIVGDITPTEYSGVTKEDKAKAEDEAMKFLTHLLEPASKDASNSIYQIFREYEDSKTHTSHLVHDLDKLELIMQAYEYDLAYSQNKQNSASSSKMKSLDQFYSALNKIKNANIRQVGEEIIRRRNTIVS
jgi:putative hydrolase of HD superfamily